MRKKFFSLILILCLIFPYSFMLASCGKKDNNSDGGSGGGAGGGSGSGGGTPQVAASGFEFSYSGSEAIVEGLSDTNNKTELVIPSSVKIDGNTYTVTSVADSAFEDESLITAVTLPSTIKEIGEKAFADCNLLSKVEIPNNIEKIGENAFEDSYFLREIKVYKQGNYVTKNGRKLTLVVPENLISTGYQNKKSLTMESDFVADGVFKNYTGLDSVSIIGGDNFDFIIGDYAFYNTAIEDFSISGSIKTIGAFGLYSSGLERIMDTSKLTKIGEQGLACLNLSRTFEISVGLTDIGKGAFNGANYKFRVDENNPKFSSDEKGNLYNKDKTHLINFVETTTSNTLEIPKNVKTIGEYCYSGRMSGGSVTLNFETGSALETIGDYAFYNTKFATINFPASLKTIGDYAFYTSGAQTSLNFGTCKLTEIGDYAFYNMNSASSGTQYFQINAADEGLVIGDYALGNFSEYKIKYNGPITFGANVNGFTFSQFSFVSKNGTYYADYNFTGNLMYKDPVSGNVTLLYAKKAYTGEEDYVVPDGVKYIADNAFSGNDYLESVTIPASVERIGDKAFYDCISLATVSIEAESNLKYIGDYAFANTNVTSFIIPDGVEEVGDRAFSYEREEYTGQGDYHWFNRITSINIPASLTKIGEGAFEGNLTISSFDSSNPAYAFVDGILYTKDMKNLICCSTSAPANVVIPATCELIKPFAFYNCTLDNLSFEANSNMTLIGKEAFVKLTIAEEIVLSNTITEIGERAFKEFYGTFVTIPENVNEIKKDTFKDANLDAVFLSDNLKEIQETAFYDSRITGNITIPKGVEKLGEAVFREAQFGGISFEDNATALTEIPNYAFYYVISESNFVLPEGIVYVGEYAFTKRTGYSYFAEINLPVSLAVIDDYGFYNATTDYSIKYNNKIKYVGDYAFYSTSFDFSFGDIYSEGHPVSERFSELKFIGDFAFAENSTHLTRFVISEKLEFIGASAFKNTHCSFWYEGNTKLKYICDGAFVSATGTFTIARSVKFIGTNIFSASKITSVIFEDPANWLVYGSAGGAVDKTSLESSSSAKNYLTGSMMQKNRIYKV